MTDSRHPDAGGLLQQAMQLHQQGQLEQADNFYAEFLRNEPDHPQALRLSGILARETGRYDKSLELLVRLASLQSDNPNVIEEIALTYMGCGQLADASAALDHALSLDPDSPGALANKGALLHFRGHSAEAVRFYKRALKQAKDDIELRCNLAKALADAGDEDAAIRECDKALKQTDNHPMIRSIKASILADTGQHKEAIELLEGCIEFADHDEMILINLGFCLQASGNHQQAIEHWRQAVSINPHNARAVSDLAMALTAHGEAQQAKELCDGFLLRYPGEPLVLAAFGYARIVCDPEDNDLFDYEQLITPVHPFSDSEVSSLNNSLSDTIATHPSLAAEPLNKSTTGGSQTGELDPGAEESVAKLHAAAEKQVRATAVGWSDQHPSKARATNDYGIRSWGTVLGSGGRQSPHIHPTAWVSGVYYSQLPDTISDDSDAGWIEFGLPPERTGLRAVLPESFRSYKVKPEAGLMVIFPSYLYHQTIPFRSTTQRVSIAFDAVPMSAMAMF